MGGADGPPPVDVPVPWRALPVAAALALPLSLLPAWDAVVLAATGLSPYSALNALLDMAHPVLRAALFVLGVVCMDRIARRWSQPLRWSIGMAAAGAVPLYSVLSLIGDLLRGWGWGLPWPQHVGWLAMDAVWVAPVGAALGWVLGRVCSRPGGEVRRALVAAVVFDVALLYAYWAAQAYARAHCPGESTIVDNLDSTWRGCCLRSGFPVAVVVSLALASQLAFAKRKRRVPSQPAERATPATRRQRIARVTPAALLALSLLAGACGWATFGRRTALLYAADSGDEQKVRRWLDAGVDPNAFVPDEDYLPLHRAAGGGDQEIIALLLERGADVDALGRRHVGTALHSAVRAWWQDGVAEGLIERGADVNARTVDFGKTPLHEALDSGDTELVRLLLEHGADPNATDVEGRTLLHWAAEGAAAPTIELLLDHGADPTLKNADGDTPLDIVSRRRPATHPSTELLREAMDATAGEEAN